MEENYYNQRFFIYETVKRTTRKHATKEIEHNTRESAIRICYNGRKEGCPFSFKIVIDTPEVKINKYLCFWGYKYDKEV